MYLRNMKNVYIMSEISQFATCAKIKKILYYTIYVAIRQYDNKSYYNILEKNILRR